mgnify:CR=1 FL=1
MTDYDFRSLSSHEFEVLCRDLLSAEWGVALESFAAGPDGGIDLRHLTDGSSAQIVQCKHYVETGLAGLRSHLRLRELPKVKELNPNRYVLATSVAMTPAAKLQVLEDLEGQIVSTTDVLAAGDINGLITRHPSIERRHFKLWLSSLMGLDHVVNAAVYNRSEFHIEELSRKVKLYAPTPSFDEAREKLEGDRVVILTGDPGVGKTMLAEMLVIPYLETGYDAYFVADMHEAEVAWRSADPQLFVYDDFLGQTSLEQKLAPHEDSRISTFIKRVRRAKNKRLVFTTREYILRDAKNTYGKLKEAVIDDLRYVVDIGHFGAIAKARILYNHVYHSPLSPEQRAAFAPSEAHQPIIDHPNYNPRTLADILDRAHSSADTVTPEAVLDALNSPVQVWGVPFDDQLNDVQRSVLLSMVTFPGPAIRLDDLRQTSGSVHEELDGTRVTPKSFRTALEVLEGTFITIRTGADDIVVAFRNPGVRDFVEGYCEANAEIVPALVASVGRSAQLEYLLSLVDSTVLRQRPNPLTELLYTHKRTLLDAAVSRLTAPWDSDADGLFSLILRVHAVQPGLVGASVDLSGFAQHLWEEGWLPEPGEAAALADLLSLEAESDAGSLRGAVWEITREVQWGLSGSDRLNYILELSDAAADAVTDLGEVYEEVEEYLESVIREGESGEPEPWSMAGPYLEIARTLGGDLTSLAREAEEFTFDDEREPDRDDFRPSASDSSASGPIADAEIRSMFGTLR